MMSHDEGRNSFVRGITVGAIIGAIVAGSSLWSRRRRERHVTRDADLAPAETASAVDPPRGTSAARVEDDRG